MADVSRAFSAPRPDLSSRTLRYAYAVFFVGGMPALIYQVAWQRVLTLYFGVDVYSTSVIVSTFLLGLGIGSLAGGWLADRVARPALWYAAAEILMGVIGFFSLPVVSTVGHWLGGASLSGVVLADFALLLIPTTLMGMTLPLMCRVVVSGTADIGRRLSWLYGVNTLGAAVGALLASYLLIGLLGLDGATYLAAALNFALAGAVYALVSMRPAGVDPAPRAAVDAAPPVLAPDHGTVLPYRFVLACSFLSGFTALGYEIVWYRVLGLVLHGTVYVFGTILFSFLTGIAAGSLLARNRIDRGNCIERFALCQLGIAAYAFALFTLLGHFSWLPGLRHMTAASFFTSFHPSLDLVTGHVDLFSLYSLADIGLWSLLLLGVPTLLMGYAFPNLMREGSRNVETLGRAVGTLYFANILGSTIGGLTVGFVALHYLGIEHALRLLIVIGAATAITVHVWKRPAAADADEPPRRRVADRRLTYAAAALIVLTLVAFPARGAVVRALHFADHDGVAFVAAEDRSGVSALRLQREVVAFEQESRILNERRLYIDGSLHGDVTDGVVNHDWSVQMALAAHAAPRRILSIGLGDGIMAATAVLSPDVEQVVIVELNSTLQRILGRTVQGRTVLDSSKVDYVVDDGRRWLLANPGETFDVIMMWPLHAAHAFSGSLYSREFLELAARHLNQGGLVLLKTADLYATPKTLATVFPHVLRLDVQAYVAGSTTLLFDAARVPPPVEESVRRITADRDLILAHTREARINTDFRPNSEYYITYPFAWSLRPQIRSEDIYQVPDPAVFRRLLVGDGHTRRVTQRPAAAVLDTAAPGVAP